MKLTLVCVLTSALAISACAAAPGQSHNPASGHEVSNNGEELEDGPDLGFAIHIEQDPIALPAGGSTDIAITLTRTGGFSETVALSVEGLPSGVTGTFLSSTLAGSAGNGTLTLSAANDAIAASAVITVRAASGRTEKTASATLNISGLSDAALHIGLTTDKLTVARGQYAWVHATFSRTGNYTGLATLTRSGLPNGVTLEFGHAYEYDDYGSTQSTISNESQNQSVLIEIAPTASLGTANVELRLTSKTVGAAVDGVVVLTLTIVDAGAPESPTFTTLAVGNQGACGVRADNKTYCWGLTQGDTSGARKLVPTAVAGGHDFVKLAYRNYTVCGISRLSDLFCWGANTQGILGDGTTTYRYVPTAVIGGHKWSEIASGGDHTCGLTNEGKAYCWGYQASGQLGDGVFAETNADYVTMPTEVLGGLTFEKIFAAPGYTCALTYTGTAYCWGYNLQGRLGDGTTISKGEPTLVTGGRSFSSLALSGSHTCGIANNGDVYCWGSEIELGNGKTSGSVVLSPQLLNTGLKYTHVSASGTHDCVIAVGGAASCWGGQWAGGLGDGTSNYSTTGSPVAVLGGLSFNVVATGFYGSCGITTEGRAYCWGYNSHGQVGDGTTTNQTSPVPLLTF